MQPDHETLIAYDIGAGTYATHRRPRDPRRARTFAAASGDGVRLDLGCGPGLWFAHLGRPLIGMDASAAMLAAARLVDPSVPLVQGALEGLPFGEAAFVGVWANKCLQHVDPADMSIVLGDLARIISTGGHLDVELFAGSGTFRSDDDLPGRRFALWDAHEFAGLVAANGFDVVHLEVVGAVDGRDLDRILLTATRR